MEYAMRYAVAVVLWPLDLLAGLLMSCRVWARRIIKPFLRWLPLWVKPNHFTYLRIFLTIPICILIIYRMLASAFILYLVACVTDFLDGALADYRNECTTWGKMLDPVADKILQISSLLVLIYVFLAQQSELKIAIGLNVGIDFCTALFAWIMFSQKEELGGANKFGKTKFGFQCTGVFLIMLDCYQLALVALSLSAIMGICSAVKHLQK